MSSSTPGGVKDPGKDGGRVKLGPTEEIDRSIFTDESTGSHVTNQAIVFDLIVKWRRRRFDRPHGCGGFAVTRVEEQEGMGKRERRGRDFENSWSGFGRSEGTVL